MQDLQPDLNPEMSPDQGIGLPNGETDREGAMAKADLYKLATYSFKLFKKIQDEDQMEAWVQAKITKAADYIASVYHYLEYEMEFSEYGKKIDNSDVYNEDQKRELKNKLLEAKEMVKALKKKQADKLSKKVAEDQEELKKSGDTFKTQHGVATKTDTGIKHTRTSKPEDDEDYVPPKKPSKAAKSSAEKAGDRAADKEQNKKSKELNKKFPGTVRRYQDGKEVPIKEVSSDTLKSYYKKAGDKIYGHIASGDYADDKDADRKLDKRLKGSERADARLDKRKRDEKAELDEAKKSPKAKKDYDKDGKVESEKDEVIGSRRKAAGLDEAKTCNETHKGTSCPVHGLKECPMEEAAPSAGMTKKEKSAVVKKAKAGEDIGKPGKGFEKVEKAAKKSGAKDPKAVAAAAMWKSAKKKAVNENVNGAPVETNAIPQTPPSQDIEQEGMEQLGGEAAKIAKIFQDLQKNEPEKFAQAAAQGEEAMAQLVASKMNPTANATDAPMDMDSAMAQPEAGEKLQPLSESIDRIRFLSGLK